MQNNKMAVKVGHREIEKYAQFKADVQSWTAIHAA